MAFCQAGFYAAQHADATPLLLGLWTASLFYKGCAASFVVPSKPPQSSWLPARVLI